MSEGFLGDRYQKRLCNFNRKNEDKLRSVIELRKKKKKEANIYNRENLYSKNMFLENLDFQKIGSVDEFRVLDNELRRPMPDYNIILSSGEVNKLKDILLSTDNSKQFSCSIKYLSVLCAGPDFVLKQFSNSPIVKSAIDNMSLMKTGSEVGYLIAFFTNIIFDYKFYLEFIRSEGLIKLNRLFHLLKYPKEVVFELGPFCHNFSVYIDDVSDFDLKIFLSWVDLVLENSEDRDLTMSMLIRISQIKSIKFSKSMIEYMLSQLNSQDISLDQLTQVLKVLGNSEISQQYHYSEQEFLNIFSAISQYIKHDEIKSVIYWFLLAFSKNSFITKFITNNNCLNFLAEGLLSSQTRVRKKALFFFNNLFSKEYCKNESFTLSQEFLLILSTCLCQYKGVEELFQVLVLLKKIVKISNDCSKEFIYSILNETLSELHFNRQVEVSQISSKILEVLMNN